MNIQDFKFYRKNNRYYFESELLEGNIIIQGKEVASVMITNGEESMYDLSMILYKEWELVELFNENIAAVLGAESI